MAVSPFGAEPDGASGLDRTFPDAYVLTASLSADGAVVVFQPEASDLVAGPKDSEGDIFLRVLGDPFPFSHGFITREEHAGGSPFLSVTVKIYLGGEAVETLPSAPVDGEHYAIQLPPESVVFSVRSGRGFARAGATAVLARL